MQSDERVPLLRRNNGLSVFFAIICVVDVFGVFPVVALPKPIIDCGYYGILVIILVCSIQIYTAVLLGKCWNMAVELNPTITRKNRYPYSALAEMTFGKYSSYYVTLLLDLSIFGGGIPNLIVAAQNVELLVLRISDESVDVSFCYWIIILGTALCPVLWLGSPKDMKILCTISAVTVTSVYLLTCGCLIFTTSHDLPKEESITAVNSERWKLLMTAYGIVAFQFDIHPTVLTIQMDMDDKTKLPAAVSGGFLASLFMFGTTSVLAVAKYGSAIKPSILETLPTSIPLHFAAALVAIQLCLTSAVSNSAMYQHMEDSLNIPREFNLKRCILRTIVTMLAIVTAESVPRFDLVMSLIGGTLTGPLVFVLPPLFYIRMVYMHRKHIEMMGRGSFANITFTESRSESPREEYSRDLVKYYKAKFREEFQNERPTWMLKYLNRMWNTNIEIILCGTIIVSSICATCITTYLNISSAALSYGNFSKPCIYNISNALLNL